MAAVHEALFEILNSLSVEKGAKLPSNMGGKPYITAVDLNLEIKRKFVEHGLILVPNERETHKELVVNQGSGKITVTLSIEGTYEIIAKEDGSSVTISGSGDGLAMGSAVASNIASTNALKNALLRTFLVTEQSAEDRAKGGLTEDPTPTPTPTPAPDAAPTIFSVRGEISTLLKTSDSNKIREEGSKFFRGKPAEKNWPDSLEALVQWRDALKEKSK